MVYDKTAKINQILTHCRSSHFTVNLQHRHAGPILSVFPALIMHSELKSVHPGFPVAFIF